jgi:hypothetical protein
MFDNYVLNAKFTNKKANSTSTKLYSKKVINNKLESIMHRFNKIKAHIKKPIKN